jgi:hypothetical protein
MTTVYTPLPVKSAMIIREFVKTHAALFCRRSRLWRYDPGECAPTEEMAP